MGEPIFSFSGVIATPGEDLPSGRRVVADSTGNAVVASQEPSWLNQSGTTISWINRNGVVLDSVHIQNITPLDLALDAQDNIYIAGYILPYAGLETGDALNACRPNEVTQRRAALVKVNAASKQADMAVCLGTGYATTVAVDAAGAIYVGGSALSDSLPVSPDALKSVSYSWGDAYNGAVYDGFLVKLAPSGQRLYSTYVGGPGRDEITALAVDNEGSVYLTGATDSAGLGTNGTLSPNRVGSVLYRSIDHGSSWKAIGSGLPWTGVRMVARQPGSTRILYALASPSDRGSSRGIFRSSDGGENWDYVGPNPGDFDTEEVRALLISRDGTIYVAYSQAFFRSSDDGVNWTKLPAPVGDWTRLQLSADGALYLSTTSLVLLRSTDRGERWDAVFKATQQCGVPDVSAAPAVIFLEADRKLLRSVDGGTSWNEAGPWGVSFTLGVSPSAPLVLYRVSGSSLLDRSNDGGGTWTRWTNQQVPGQRVVVDAQNPDIVYSVDSIFSSREVWRLDGAGQKFLKLDNALGNLQSFGLLSSLEKPSELLLTTTAALDAFVLKLRSDHSVSYSTYLGGSGNDRPTAIRIDSSGRAYIAGFTGSQDMMLPGNAYQRQLHPLDDFPGMEFSDPRPATNGGIVRYEWGTDGFLAALEADGSRLTLGTYLGGGQSEIITDVELLPDGTVLICGMTDSYDFPRTPDALNLRYYRDRMTAFLVRLTPDADALLFSTQLSGNGNGLQNWADSLVVTPTGNVYVTGFGNSEWYRTSPGQVVNGIAFVSVQFADYLSLDATPRN